MSRRNNWPPVSLGRVMRTVSKVLLALCLLWNVGALAQQPTPFLPYPDLTPGGVFDVTLQDICTPGYSKKVRAVTKALRDQAYKSYGITSYQPGEYQLDHLIPLSIGGSNSILNLWPQSNNTSPWNARTKDALEQRLRKLVCSGQVDLETAQREIATNWINAYQKYIGASPPSRRAPSNCLHRVAPKTRCGSIRARANTGSRGHSFSAKPNKESS